MTFANLKGGYITSVEVSRDNFHFSKTMLSEELIKKSDNYVIQIPRFITNTCPDLNVIDEIMFEILPRGDHNENLAQALNRLPLYLQVDALRQFKPTGYKSWSELARLMSKFFKRLTTLSPNPELIVFSLRDNGTFTLTFSSEFSDTFYIKVGPQTQLKTGFPEYIFQIVEEVGQVTTVFTHVDGIDNLFTVANGVVSFSDIQDDVPNPVSFISSYSLNKFDDRLSIDCICTLPIASKISVLNGVERRDFVLCRFPFVDLHEIYSEVTSDETFTRKQVIEERIDLGLTDFTRGNPDSVGVLMLPGYIQVMNIVLQVRYFTGDGIFTKDMNFSNGFFDFKLLFSKKST